MKSIVRVETHPAYTKTTLKGNQFKNQFPDNAFPSGTPPVSAAVNVIYKLTELKNPPSHLPLGVDAIEAAKKKYAQLLADAEKLVSWSEGLVA